MRLPLRGCFAMVVGLSMLPAPAAFASSQTGKIAVKCTGLKSGVAATLILSRRGFSKIKIPCGTKAKQVPAGRYFASGTTARTEIKVYIPKTSLEQLWVRSAKSQTVEIFYRSKLIPVVASYFATARDLAWTEQSLLDRYSAVSGENYTDDATMASAVYDLLPDVNEYISRIEAVYTPTPSLEKAHGLYVQAWNKESEGLTLILSALIQQDYTILAAANRALSDGRNLMRKALQAWSLIKSGP